VGKRNKGNQTRSKITHKEKHGEVGPAENIGEKREDMGKMCSPSLPAGSAGRGDYNRSMVHWARAVGGETDWFGTDQKD